MKVHILVTCRTPDLLPAATLVFKTLRVGFPTATVTAWLNCAPNHDCGKVITDAMQQAQVQQCGWEPRKSDKFLTEQTTIHHKWILGLLDSETEPFYILDTDVVFWKLFELYVTTDTALAGRYIPQFMDSFTKCITRPRLHTSLLYLNPALIKEKVSAYLDQFPDTPFNPKPNLIYPCFYPHRQGATVRNYFHDTACMLYQAIGGQSFTEEQLECYDHLNFGTISDLVAPHYPELRFRESHFAVFENPELARGIWRSQDRFYAARAV